MEVFQTWHEDYKIRNAKEKPAGPVTWETGSGEVDSAKDKKVKPDDVLVDAPSDDEKVFRKFTEEFESTFKLETPPAEVIKTIETDDGAGQNRPLNEKDKSLIEMTNLYD